MHQDGDRNLIIIESEKHSSVQIDAKNAKMTSPIQKVLSDINKEKSKNRLKISDLFK